MRAMGSEAGDSGREGCNCDGKVPDTRASRVSDQPATVPEHAAVTPGQYAASKVVR